MRFGRKLEIADGSERVVDQFLLRRAQSGVTDGQCGLARILEILQQFHVDTR